MELRSDTAQTTSRQHGRPSALVSLFRFVVSSLNLWACTLILVFFLALLLLRFSGVALGPLQWLFFVPLLIAVAALPRRAAYRMPRYLVFFALFLWVIAAGDVWGALRGRFFPASVYVAPIPGDTNGGQTREFVRRLESGGIPAAALYNFSEVSDEIFGWLRFRPAVSAVLVGNKSWGNLFVNYGRQPLPFELTEGFLADAARFGVDAAADGFLVGGAIDSDPFVVLTRVDSVAVPTDPPELLGQYLSAVNGTVQQLARGRDVHDIDVSGLRTAAVLEGGWRSSTPAAYAEFLAGTVMLAQSSDPGELRCVLAIFEHAYTILQRRSNAELAAAIQHNLAIASLVAAEDFRAHTLATRQLVRVSHLKGRNGEPLRAARAAKLNLATIRRNGIE